MIDEILIKLSTDLKKEHMDCVVFDADQEFTKPRLLVYLGNDDEKRERVLEITVDEQVLPSHFKDYTHMEVKEGIYRLQVQSIVPIEFVPKQAGDIASVINFLNGMLELPGFLSDEVENKVLYRTVQLIAQKELTTVILTGIVGMHRMVLDVFTSLLQKVGTGQMSYFEFLDEVVKYTTPQNQAKK